MKNKLRQIALSVVGFLIAFPASAQTAATGPYLAPQAVKNFYAASGDGKVWENGKQYTALLHGLEALRDHGLNPDHYHYEALAALTNAPAKREKLATDAWFSAASHMIYGKLDPLTIEPDWTAARRKVDLATKLRTALESGNVATSLEELAPQQPGYEKLRQELARLRKLPVNHTTRIQIQDGPTLRAGDQGERVQQLRHRLIELGHLTQSDITRPTFDAQTDAAVKAFQSHEGLDSDGLVGAATREALNRTVGSKIGQIRVNLERWRWLPDELGRRHIRVNIADFNLTTWENGAAVKTHRTIVGKAYRKTPVFSGSIRYVVFNPWWETPNSIARKDKLPAFQKDPSSVSKLGFEVLDNKGQKINPDTINWRNYSGSNFPFRLRQSPGPQNALGQVKIMFPNQHSVYIHDTPNRELFNRSTRAMSSGCVRTQHPLDLTAWLLMETPAWPKEAQDIALASGKETRADLNAPVPVHVLYSTVVADADGRIRYLNDVYERDAAVFDALKETYIARPIGLIK
ncbi:MAG: L,D-transpeptidase family protein [Alphaproteobacteria bacterium]